LNGGGLRLRAIAARPSSRAERSECGRATGSGNARRVYLGRARPPRLVTSQPGRLGRLGVL